MTSTNPPDAAASTARPASMPSICRVFVIPFLLMLPLTGGIMIIYVGVGNDLGQAPR